MDAMTVVANITFMDSDLKSRDPNWAEREDSSGGGPKWRGLNPDQATPLTAAAPKAPSGGVEPASAGTKGVQRRKPWSPPGKALARPSKAPKKTPVGFCDKEKPVQQLPPNFFNFTRRSTKIPLSLNAHCTGVRWRSPFGDAAVLFTKAQWADIEEHCPEALRSTFVFSQAEGMDDQSRGGTKAGQGQEIWDVTGAGDPIFEDHKISYASSSSKRLQWYRRSEYVRVAIEVPIRRSVCGAAKKACPQTITLQMPGYEGFDEPADESGSKQTQDMAVLSVGAMTIFGDQLRSQIYM